MDYVITLILPHSRPTLNLILSPDPDPEQSGLRKGGGVGERGEHVDYIVHAQY